MPYFFGRIQLRRIRWYKNKSDIVRDIQALGFVKSPIVQKDNFKFFWFILGELLEINLECSAVTERQFQFKMVSAEGRISPKEVGKLKSLLKMANGLYSASG
jgi:hypothetical protein